ncbi:hypothetical protein [Pseudomonas sp. MPC6]|uniref:hypothetical protein n=1 Tax=unclassified Pseudomonas TaxID=196821 RepID=UPI001110F31C|nr:hypothetical protein [Pseudomonas sp. MPC6]QCY09355.1 hypothetical protein ELQ88_00320 [Pseudomonas sp. MPC6]
MIQSSDKPAPLPAPRPVILAEGSVLAVQRLCKAKAAYLAGPRSRVRKTSACRRSTSTRRST